MKPSKVRKSFALALALAAVTASCSTLRLPNDVAIKAVPIDLVFGGETEAPVTQPSLPSFPEPAIIDLPEIVPQKPPITFTPKILCPPAGPNAYARKAVPSNISMEDSESKKYWPEEGNYLFGYNGDFADDGELDLSANAYRYIERVVVRQNSLPGYDVRWGDSFTGIHMWFTIVPSREEGLTPEPPNSVSPADNTPDPGLYLKRLDIPQRDGSRVEAFIPEPPLLMMKFSVEDGSEVVSRADDTALKSKGQDLPGGLRGPSNTTMTSTMTVGGKEIVEVCSDLVQAWKTNWTIDIAGTYNDTLTGTFWIALHYGGLPVRDDFILDTADDDNLIGGTFSSNMMRLDPGNYL